MTQKISRAMVLAAGLGRRLRPLTDTTPKPLIQVNGRALIDYSLDLVRGAGLQKVAVNCHYLADQIEAHVQQISDLQIDLSDERGQLLETGGGVQKALPLLGDQPFAVLNSDVIIQNKDQSSLKQLVNAWDADQMDILLLLQPKEKATGYDGKGDYILMADGQLQRPEAGAAAPYIFAGVQIVNPDLFDGVPEGAFSMNLLFDKAEAAGRLFGYVHDGIWLHVGTEDALKDAEGILKASE